MSLQDTLKKAGTAFRSFWSAPDIVQKVGIVGAGLVVYPLVIWLIWIVWKGGWTVAHQSEQIEILGKLAIGAMLLFGLVVLALLGVTKAKVDLPGGAGIDFDTGKDEPHG